MPRVVVFDEFGGPEVLKVVEEPAARPGPGQVRVRIEAFAVNPLDLMMRSGMSPAPVPLPHARLGVEATGVVDALGPGVEGLRVGDQVIVAAVPDASANGTYADYALVQSGRVVARPAGLTAVEAAAVWVGYSTAYGALIETAGMRPGDRVLITAASGSVGRAAIQIANYLGATPIAVTRHSDKRGELLGAGAVIATDTEDLAAAVATHTGGVGADITLDLVGGPGTLELGQATRAGGSLIVAGFLDPRPALLPTALITTRRYRSYDHTLDPAAVQRMAALLNAAVANGALRPTVERTFTLDNVSDAHAYVERGARSGGKVVVTT